MKQVMSFTIDHTIKESIEELARANKLTASKYIASVLTYHVQEERNKGEPKPEVVIQDEEEEIELTASEEAEFLRAVKHQPSLTRAHYIRWKLSQ